MCKVSGRSGRTELVGVGQGQGWRERSSGGQPQGPGWPESGVGFSARAVGALVGGISGRGGPLGSPQGALWLLWGWAGKWQDVRRQVRWLLQGLTPLPLDGPRCPRWPQASGVSGILGPMRSVTLGAFLPAPGPWKPLSPSLLPSAGDLGVPWP